MFSHEQSKIVTHFMETFCDAEDRKWFQEKLLGRVALFRTLSNHKGSAECLSLRTKWINPPSYNVFEAVPLSSDVMILSNLSNCTVRVVGLARLDEHCSFQRLDGFEYTSFVPVSDKQLVIAYENSMSFWDGESDITAEVIASDGRFSRLKASLLLNNTRLVVGTDGGVVELWDLSLPAHPVHIGTSSMVGAPVSAMAAYSDDKIVIGRQDCSLEILDLKKSGRESVCDTLSGSNGSEFMKHIAISPDGRIIGSFDKHRASSIIVWKPPGQKNSQRVSAGQSCVSTIKVLANGLVVSAADDGTVKFWNFDLPEDKACVATFVLYEEPFGKVIQMHLAALPDGRVAVGSSDETGSVKILDPSRPEENMCIATLEHGEGKRINTIMIRPSSLQLVICCDDGDLRIWDFGEVAKASA